MQIVFPSLEQTAHVWANQSQDYGRNSTGSLFFKENIIYSYGEHYPIAKIVENSHIVVFNDAQSSATTQTRHKPAVMNALPYHKIILNVTNVEDAFVTKKADIENQLYLIERISIVIKQHFRAKTVSRYGEISLLSDQYKVYRNNSLHPIDNTWYENIDWDAIEEQNDYLHKKHSEMQRKKDIQLENREQNRINKFFGTKNISYDTSLDYVKIKGNELRTDKGARVPLSEAVVLKRMYKKNPDSIIGKSVGYFAVDAITDSYIRIGCHMFSIKHLLESIPDKIGANNECYFNP